MEVSYIEKKSVDDLRISTIVKDRIFFMKGNRLESKCIYSYDAESSHYVKLEERVDYICNFNDCILVLCGNTLHKYRLFGDEMVLSSSHRLRESPLKIFLCGKPEVKESYAVCFLYGSKQIEIFVESVESITVCCRGDVAKEDDIVDFFVTDTSAWFLAKSGNIYHTHSFVLTRSVFLSKPVRMLPEPTNFSGDANSILVKDDKLYVSYGDGFEVYEIHKGVLVLVYTYRTSNFELVVFESVFCLEENLLVVDDAPKVVANTRVQKLFGNVGVSSDKIIFIRKECGSLERKGVRLLKEGDSEMRTLEMFRMVSTDFEVPELGCVEDEEKISEKTFLMVQKVVNDFESRILDGYRRIYFELVTLNESFPEKIAGVDVENEMILKKVDVLDGKKNALMDRLRRLNDDMHGILSKIKVDGRNGRMLADQVNKALDGLSFKKYEKYAKILRMQREVLNRKIV